MAKYARNGVPVAAGRGQQIGVITKGSLVEGVEMKLDPEQNVEDMKAGKFVVIEGDKNDFFSMVTDMRLDANNQEILLHPPGQEDALLRQGARRHQHVQHRLAAAHADDVQGRGSRRGPRPVKAIPSHFSEVQEAMAEDVAKIFGSEGDAEGRYFSIGHPLDMDTQVCLDMIRFAERSNGIFGKTGTGKSFLTRLVLCGLIHFDKAVNLIFDMHNEYGFKAMKENGSTKTFVKGLKQLFGERVAIFSLDPQSTRARGVQPDHEVYISYDQITVRRHCPAARRAQAQSHSRGVGLLGVRDLQGALAEHAPEVGRPGCRRICPRDRCPRRVFSGSASQAQTAGEFSLYVSKLKGGDVVDRIMEYLDKGINVVLEFGQQTSMLCYLLVANIIARRIHEMYVKKSERFYATQRAEDQPRQLMITIEEAHKFLNPMAAKQTIFGTIAREMRKYYVSLLVVDQRPSSIDDEVLSQIGTRITALLNDEKDIQAVLTGVSGTEGLRSVLASLDSKQQALILGHAVPMPVVIKTRDYDAQFYSAMGSMDDLPAEERREKVERDVAALFGE